LIVTTDPNTDEYVPISGPPEDIVAEDPISVARSARGLYLAEHDNLGMDHFEWELEEYGRLWGAFQLRWERPGSADPEYDAMNAQRKKLMGMIRELRDKNRG
jgi:hypothetical protein